VRRLRARHARPPFGSSLLNRDRIDVPHLSESALIGIESLGFVERRESLKRPISATCG
jgi:hypothetical protein